MSGRNRNAFAKSLLLGGVIVALGSVAICSVLIVVLGPLMRYSKHAQLAYIEQTTGITVPIAASEIDVFDNLEYYTVAHVKLREDDVASFADVHEFGTTSVDVMLEIKVLKEENRTIPEDGDLRYLEGRDSGTRWMAVLDRSSGRLWVVVFYPDPGGTVP